MLLYKIIMLLLIVNNYIILRNFYAIYIHTYYTYRNHDLFLHCRSVLRCLTWKIREIFDVNILPFLFLLFFAHPFVFLRTDRRFRLRYLLTVARFSMTFRNECSLDCLRHDTRDLMIGRSLFAV